MIVCLVETPGSFGMALRVDCSLAGDPPSVAASALWGVGVPGRRRVGAAHVRAAVAGVDAGADPEDEGNSCDSFHLQVFVFWGTNQLRNRPPQIRFVLSTRTVLGVRRTVFRAIRAPRGGPAGCVRQAGAGGGRVTHGGSVEPSRRKRQRRMAGSLAVASATGRWRDGHVGGGLRGCGGWVWG